MQFLDKEQSRPLLGIFDAAIFWTSLNPAAPRHDEPAIAMTTEAGRTWSVVEDCGVSGRRLADADFLSRNR
jgi:hypothetical protein